MRNLFCRISLMSFAACISPDAALAQDPCDGYVRDAQEGAPWCEDFEINSGPNANCYDTQNCTVQLEIPRACNGWYSWFDESPIGVVTCEQNHTPDGEQSFALDDFDDSVRVFEGYSIYVSEFWILSTYIYIPSTMEGDAYWIVLNDYEIDGHGSTNWAIQCLMSVADGTIHDDFEGGELPLITDQWVELRAEINFAADRVRLFYNDEFLSQYAWSIGGGELRIRAMDLFNYEGTRFYADDMSLCPAELPRTPGNGDYDLDGDVDLLDFQFGFLGCFTGPNEPWAIRECGRMDFEPDNDVDFADFGKFQLAFTGPRP